MDNSINRRDFIRSAAAAGMAAVIGESAGAFQQSGTARSAAKPLVISSANGLQATAKAMEMIKQGSDALDAIVAGVNIVEDDPKDNSVGYGGLPNEEGVVELDASVMHGPSGRGGAVASIRNIKNPSKVAKLVMERSDHVLIVGEGALRFAKAHGFQEENLLTIQGRSG
ncbi:MAG: glycosylasparaginase precursor, Threonine peptidase, MEROPS family T02 [Bacteroidetes bacterium]|nr:glycosylasparaginase precursor, Threonine peptidase, MEROPS family T02 [Bacteroidota bacterium]